MRKQVVLGALLGIFFAAGCSDDSGPTGPATSTLPQTIHGTVSGASLFCHGTDDVYGELDTPCESFLIVPPRRGTLVARLTWPERNTYLLMGSGSSTFVQWNFCSASGCESRFAVGTRETTLWVGLDTRRSSSSSQAFEVNLSLE
jgi:hypothetical protein